MARVPVTNATVNGGIDEAGGSMQSDKMDGHVTLLNRGLDRAAIANPTDPTIWRKLSTILSGCGWKKKSRQRMARLTWALTQDGIFTSVDLENMDVGNDTKIHFGRRPFPELGNRFGSERALAFYMGEFPSSIEGAVPEVGRLRLRHGGEKGEKVFYVDGDPVKPDLVFRSSRGDWIVVELEKAEPPLDGTEQIERYVRALKQSRKEPVIGLFITGRPKSRGLTQHVDRQIATLLTEGLDVRWLWYDVDVRLRTPD